MKHSITFSSDQKSILIEEFIPTALSEGFAHGKAFITEEQLAILHAERKRMRPNIVLNTISHLLQRIEGELPNPTFHPVSPTWQGLRLGDGFDAFQGITSGTPRFLLPGVIDFGSQLAIAIQEAGGVSATKTLQTWTCDKITMTNNALPGGLAGFVGEHTDTSTENISGLRAIASLGHVSLYVGGDLVDVQEADIELFICADTAQEVGAILHPHSTIPVDSRAAFIFDSFPKKTH